MSSLQYPELHFPFGMSEITLSYLHTLMFLTDTVYTVACLLWALMISPCSLSQSQLSRPNPARCQPRSPQQLTLACSILAAGLLLTDKGFLATPMNKPHSNNKKPTCACVKLNQRGQQERMPQTQIQFTFQSQLGCSSSPKLGLQITKMKKDFLEDSRHSKSTNSLGHSPYNNSHNKKELPERKQCSKSLPPSHPLAPPLVHTKFKWQD